MKRSPLVLSLTLLSASLLLLAGCGGKQAGSSGSAGGASGGGMMKAQDSPAPGAATGGTPSGTMAGAPEGASSGPTRAAGLAWTLPAGWSVGGERAMRVATYAVPAAGGSEAGECAVFYFGPNQGGGVDANVQRWIGQFEGGAKSSRSIEQVEGLQVDLVEVSGTYLAPSGPMMQSSGSKPGYRLLGAIAEGPQGAVFFKLTGPEKTVDAARKDFQALVTSIRKT